MFPRPPFERASPLATCAVLTACPSPATQQGQIFLGEQDQSGNRPLERRALQRAEPGVAGVSPAKHTTHRSRKHKACVLLELR